MKRTKPKVYLVAETKVRGFELDRYLDDVGAGDWETDAPSDSEKLVEAAGRVCYRSWKPGMNPNVTKVREGSAGYLANVIGSGHGSVLEHASATWIFRDVSRVFTHELVRHRVGTAMSQESLRYVRLDELKAYVPDCMQEKVSEFCAIFEGLEGVQIGMADGFQLDDRPFAEKKEITSAMRRLAPIGLATTIVWTANMRTLRHVIEMRTSRHAEEEIRVVFLEVARRAKERWPNLFGDYEENEHGEFVTEWRKV